MERENQKVQSGPGSTEHRKRQPTSVHRLSFTLHKGEERVNQGPPWCSCCHNGGIEATVGRRKSMGEGLSGKHTWEDLASEELYRWNCTLEEGASWPLSLLSRPGSGVGWTANGHTELIPASHYLPWPQRHQRPIVLRFSTQLPSKSLAEMYVINCRDNESRKGPKWRPPHALYPFYTFSYFPRSLHNHSPRFSMPLETGVLSSTLGQML